MDVTADELAGVVDLFGGLTPAELERALSEAAFRADGESVDEAATAATVEDALDSFALVRCDPDEVDGVEANEAVLVAGPTAFPTVPECAEDLPHILDVSRRHLDREALGAAARERFVAAVEEALADDDDDGDGDGDRARRLLDASYDLEAWAPLDLADERERLAAAAETDATDATETDAMGTPEATR